jgi:hypothetical protein
MAKQRLLVDSPLSIYILLPYSYAILLNLHKIVPVVVMTCKLFFASSMPFPFLPSPTDATAPFPNYFQTHLLQLHVKTRSCPWDSDVKLGCALSTHHSVHVLLQSRPATTWWKVVSIWLLRSGRISRVSSIPTGSQGLFWKSEWSESRTQRDRAGKTGQTRQEEYGPWDYTIMTKRESMDGKKGCSKPNHSCRAYLGWGGI